MVTRSLQRHLEWLYGPGGVFGDVGQPCLCDHVYKSLGRLYGVSWGSGWVRANTNPECAHHGG